MLLERLRQVTDQYNISWVKQDLIVMASSLHDIGKIGIDDKILNKNGKLTKEEFEVMKTHTLIGASILENLEEYQPVISFIPGWKQDISACRRWEELPDAAKNYIKTLEKLLDHEIQFISVGAKREEYLIKGNGCETPD